MLHDFDVDTVLRYPVLPFCHTNLMKENQGVFVVVADAALASRHLCEGRLKEAKINKFLDLSYPTIN